MSLQNKFRTRKLCFRNQPCHERDHSSKRDRSLRLGFSLLSLCAAYTPELTFFVRRVFVCIMPATFCVRSVFYSRAILKSSRSLFARLSFCKAFLFWVCPVEHMTRNCSSLHLLAIVHGGAWEWWFVQEDLMSHEIFPPDLLSHEPTLGFRRHQLSGLGAPSFYDHKTPTKSLNKCHWDHWNCT